MSPDWSAKEEPVPYAKLDNPQSLNLYAYMMNNPLAGVDADGHCPACLEEAEEVLEEAEPYIEEGAEKAEQWGEQAGAAIERGASSGWGWAKGVLGIGIAGAAKGDNKPSQPAQTQSTKEEHKADPEPKTSTSGGQKGTGKNGLPPDANKLKGDQGYRDKDGNTWKKDTKHKDHWDVSDKKGNKVKEVTFDGKQLWPDGPKNKNK